MDHSTPKPSARTEAPRRRILIGGAAVLAGFASGLAPVRAQENKPLVVFAAASLTDAFKDVDAAWQARGNPPLRMSFAASSTLARQIEQGAEANIFASADDKWMDELAKREILAAGTEKSLLGNALVLVMARDKVKPVTISSATDFPAILGPTGRLAVGDPSNVPVGIYAKQALTRLGLWPQVESRLAPTDTVRSGLLLVERGEAPACIVYSTDAPASENVAIAGIFPESSHDPIDYPFAITKAGDTPDARALLDFLASAEGFAIFAKRGFTKPPAS